MTETNRDHSPPSPSEKSQPIKTSSRMTLLSRDSDTSLPHVYFSSLRRLHFHSWVRLVEIKNLLVHHHLPCLHGEIIVGEGPVKLLRSDRLIDELKIIQKKNSITSSFGSWYGSRYGCSRASAAVIRFLGSKTSIFSSKSMAEGVSSYKMTSNLPSGSSIASKRLLKGTLSRCGSDCTNRRVYPRQKIAFSSLPLHSHCRSF